MNIVIHPPLEGIQIPKGSDDLDWDVEEEHEVPHKNAVCSDCEGEGRVLTQSIREHAYTPEELHEDPDFFEEYKKMGG